MTAIEIVRTTPPREVGVPVTKASLGDIASLSEGLEDYGYTLIVHTGKAYVGFGRITIRRNDFADQFADEGDWLRVTNASFTRSDTGEAVWDVSATTEVTAYGDSYPAQPYTSTAFAEQFTVADEKDAAVLVEVAAVAARVAQRREPAIVSEVETVEVSDHI